MIFLNKRKYDTQGHQTEASCIFQLKVWTLVWSVHMITPGKVHILLIFVSDTKH